MTFDEWWKNQIKTKADEIAFQPEIWIALKLLAKDSWEASRKNMKFLEATDKMRLNTKSEKIREGLIALGWTPPKDAE